MTRARYWRSGKNERWMFPGSLTRASCLETWHFRIGAEKSGCCSCLLWNCSCLDYFGCYKESCSKEAGMTVEPRWLCVVKQNMKHLIHGSQDDCNQTAHRKINQKLPGGSHLTSLCLIDHLKSCICPFLFLRRTSNIKLGKNLREILPGYRLVLAKCCIFFII